MEVQCILRSRANVPRPGATMQRNAPVPVFFSLLAGVRVPLTRIVHPILSDERCVMFPYCES